MTSQYRNQDELNTIFFAVVFVILCCYCCCWFLRWKREEKKISVCLRPQNDASGFLFSIIEFMIRHFSFTYTFGHSLLIDITSVSNKQIDTHTYTFVICVHYYYFLFIFHFEWEITVWRMCKKSEIKNKRSANTMWYDCVLLN